MKTSLSVVIGVKCSTLGFPVSDLKFWITKYREAKNNPKKQINFIWKSTTRPLVYNATVAHVSGIFIYFILYYYIIFLLFISLFFLNYFYLLF